MAFLTVRVRSRVPQARRLVHERAKAATRKAAFDIEANAKTGAPVATGFLRSSIRASGSDLDWRVDVFADYGLFVEFGTRFAAAQPFFVPAIEMVRPSYLAAMRRLA